MRHSRPAILTCVATAVSLFGCVVLAQTPPSAATPVGAVTGEAWEHTVQSLAASAQLADVVLPSEATGNTVWRGKLKDAPPTNGVRVPVVLFMHGSSGLSLKAIGEWQQWLATLGVASVAPDSFALPGRVTYKSPIDKVQYERIHGMRLSEIAPALQAIRAQPWADATKLVLAGSSEGGVPVARYTGNEFAARMIFAWSCEPNYFVSEPKNALPQDRPVLNLISASDPFFSSANTWLGHAIAKGHCGDALKDNQLSTVTLIPGAPHTLLNMPQARAVTAGFLRDALKLDSARTAR